ncbi:class I adenylate-forming enzyme family protein [Methylosinus sp. Ce-a6]|uniref:class I adenylate-forming enzyme family protein n=1 Tax=Methylosinus sp. Ce-a6 TaxID=2172005 RepID=UPI001356C2CA|nr:class I adenylate-forming enzyme family protein [Methylosinus sp. Ce-a6]
MNASGIVDLVPAAVRREWKEAGLYPNQSVFELFCKHARQNPEKVAVSSPGESTSYGALLDRALRLAAGLRARGIVAGDVVAYQIPNSWRCCTIDLAAAALGAIVAPFPPGRGRLDMESLLKRCDARAVVVTREFAGIDICEMIESLRPTALSLRLLIVDGPGKPGWIDFDGMMQSDPIPLDELPAPNPDDPVRLLVSSGTESEPKLIAYSHNALVGGRGRFLQELHPDAAAFSGLYLVPLGSAFGSTATFGVLSWIGGTVVVLPKFETAAAIEAIETLKPTFIFGVPTMLQRMAADPLLKRIDKSSLMGIVCGGSVIDEATIRRCIDAFGCKFINLYGSADGVNCHSALADDPDAVFRCVGRPNPSVCALKITDELGEELPRGLAGEIIARGPMSPMQYVNAPELDAKYRDCAGWVHTGDLGFIDADGYLVLSGRKKEIIIRGGVNISPVQIESIASSHPDVVSAACVAVPDPDLGQSVCLCLTMAEAAEKLSLAELADYLRIRGLEANKLPDYVRFYRQLPLSPAGKVDKKKLAGDIAILERGARLSGDGAAAATISR